MARSAQQQQSSSTRNKIYIRNAFLGLPQFSTHLLDRHCRSAVVAAICVALNTSPNFVLPTHPVSAAVLPETQNTSLPAAASSLDPEHALVEETWSLVQRYFISADKLNEKWAPLHDTLQQTPYRNRKAAYSAIRKGLASLDDPYSRFLTPDEMLSLQKFDVSGVGLLLTAGPNDSIVVATKPAAGTPAAAINIQQGDTLLAVEGQNVKGLGAFEIAQQMQGEDGTPLKLQFKNAGEVTLKRSFNTEKGVVGVKAFIYTDKDDGRKEGHIKLSEFRASARGDVANILRRLHKEGAERFVLDLRGNPGGVFQGALEIAGIFEGDGFTVARVSGREGMNEEYKSTVVGDEEREQIAPLAIIVDKMSASASEVLAGGLRDNCRAAILGNENSYGKGLIQGVFGLSDGSGLILTVAEYVTPNGSTIQGQGLQPDLPLTNDFASKALYFIGVDAPAKVDWNEVHRVTDMCKANNLARR